MRRARLICIGISVVFALSIIAGARAQTGQAAPVQISGAVQSFDGSTLDIKPAASPAVWVMVPADLHVDRAALKPGAQVSAEARWDGLVYIANEVTIKK
jgi:hypothetical protein